VRCAGRDHVDGRIERFARREVAHLDRGRHHARWVVEYRRERRRDRIVHAYPIERDAIDEAALPRQHTGQCTGLRRLQRRDLCRELPARRILGAQHRHDQLAVRIALTE